MNNFPVRWRNDNLGALREGGFRVDYFSDDIHNKELMERLALNRSHYEYLTQKGLINQGYCPITGDPVSQDLFYEIFGRKVYLSLSGREICEKIRREQHKEKYGEDLEIHQKKVASAKKRLNFSLLILASLSFYSSYSLIDPSGFFSYLFFIVLGIVLLLIFNFFFMRYFGSFFHAR